MPPARRGTLFGACPFALAGLAVAGRGTGVGAAFFAVLDAVLLVIRADRCSAAVSRVPATLAETGFALSLLIGGSLSGGTSSLSSSESVATRLGAGVLRGCPGGEMAPALA